VVPMVDRTRTYIPRRFRARSKETRNSGGETGGGTGSNRKVVAAFGGTREEFRDSSLRTFKIEFRRSIIKIIYFVRFSFFLR